MKQSNSGSGDMREAKGSVLGARTSMGAGAVDSQTQVFVQLCAAVMPGMSGAVMSSLERVLRIEPRQKPALRKFIADSYGNNPQIEPVTRRYKRAQKPRHDDCHRLVQRLCHVAREAGRTEARTIGNLIMAAKALGLSQDEVLSVLKKARLAG